MCLKLRLQEKCQHDALILPPEWYFGFDKESTNKKYRGLWIIKGKTAKKFRSFESAKHHAPSQFKDLKPENFYRHVGLASELPEIGTPLQSVASLSTREISPKCQSPAPPPSPNVEANQSWTLKELYERRCKVCDNCKREPCNYCHTCQHNIPVGCIRRVSVRLRPPSFVLFDSSFTSCYTIIQDV